MLSSTSSSLSYSVLFLVSDSSFTLLPSVLSSLKLLSHSQCGNYSWAFLSCTFLSIFTILNIFYCLLVLNICHHFCYLIIFFLILITGFSWELFMQSNNISSKLFSLEVAVSAVVSGTNVQLTIHFIPGTGAGSLLPRWLQQDSFRTGTFWCNYILSCLEVFIMWCRGTFFCRSTFFYRYLYLR